MGRRRVKSTSIGWVVEEHALSKARPLLTVPADSPLWGAGAEAPDVRGALVRLLPPADASDLQIAELRARLEQAGATAVRVMPRARGAGLARGGEEQRRALDPRRPIREVVLEVAARMKSRDQEALRIELNATMDEVGL